MNDTVSRVEIISCNSENEHICASAARISTTEGDACAVFSRESDAERDRRLIEKVLRSGHESCVEHAIFTLAFNNVSVRTEQFVIEFRLASYTVKSRRYVDFSSSGYYVPESLSGEARAVFTECADSLFSDYDALTKAGVPREDARFVLPYCFYSNFYCTLNARELCHMICEMRFGKGRDCAELACIASQLEAALEARFPAVLGVLVREREGLAKETTPAAPRENKCEIVSPRAELLFHDGDAYQKLALAHSFARGVSDTENVDMRSLCAELINSQRPRELEQLSYTFAIRSISLAGLTHIVRHRMQSIIVPPLETALCGGFVLPKTVDSSEETRSRYIAAFERTRDAVEKLRAMGADGDALAYLNLSGNTLDILTTMNARELLLFFKLRTCRRAQWEVRGVALSMLDELRALEPELFSLMGASCFVTGACPEGRLSCGTPYRRADG